MINLELLERSLRAEAQPILERNEHRQRYIVFDIEYAYDREGQRRADLHAAHIDGDAGNDNADRPREVRWPFHRIVCISALSFDVSNHGSIKVNAFETWSKPEMTEAAIVKAFAAFVEESDAVMPVTWGGEYKDIPAMLAVAMREGFALPSCLSAGLWRHQRLDLCDGLRMRAKPVHLNEYAHAQGLPAKLMAPWELGEAAERGKWSAIREHCECDVIVTAMLLDRWLLATGLVTGNRTDLDTLIADAVAEARPYRPQLLAAIAGFTSPPLASAA